MVVESGYVGINGAPWRLYDNGSLVVGPGRINNAAPISPWDAYSGSINNIVFEGLITTGHSLRALFANLSYVESILGLEYFDTSNVTNMQSMFSGLERVTTLNISGWDTSNVANMNSMFYNTQSLTDLDLSDWNTSNVTHMSHMFRDAAALQFLDVSAWDTSNVTTMATMFYGAESLITLDVSGWDTNRVTTMNRMFSNANALTALDVTNWDTSSVTDMTRMFQGAGSLSSLDVSGWDTRNVTNMIGMFHGANEITHLDVTSWNTSNVTNMERMFQDASGITSLDLLGWDTSNVSNMGSMFFGATNLTNLDVSSWDTSRVTNMVGMFRDTQALTFLDVSGWDTSRVTSMATMFYGASALTFLDVSNWDTRSVTTMDRMFASASGITALDVSSWYTGNVTNMSGMFQDFSGVGALDVSRWDTGSVTTMARMFRNVENIDKLDISGWDTSRVTSMLAMFQGVSGVITLDVSGWDTSNVTNMQNMFFGTSSLTVLDLSQWNVNAVTTMHSMFRGATGLTSLSLSGWDTNRNPAVNMTDMFRDTHALRRITFGDDFTNGGVYDPRLPSRNSSGEFTGMWLNITPPGGMPAVTSNELLPQTGGGPYAPGIWVWERHEGIVMLTVDGTYRFPTVAVGYPPINPLSVAVANAGRTEINVPLLITLSGTNADDFVLVHGDLPAGGIIPVGSSWAGAFSIAPAHGLDPGTYTASVTVSGEDINTETFTVSFTVLPDSIENAVIIFADAVFDGSPKQPAFLVTLENEVLTEGIDFEIIPNSWTNNINARNASDIDPPSVSIRGIGAFDSPGSELTGSFTIRPRPLTLSLGSFGLTKVYDGTASSTNASQTGSLILDNLLTSDSLRVSVAWVSVSDFGGVDVGLYDATLFGISLVSINNDDWHLNYDLGVAMMTGIPANITPASFPPILPIERSVMTGESRTITIPVSEMTPIALAPMNLGLISSLNLYNYTPGSISATATIVGDNLVITTQGDKAYPETETITVRFETQNFGNIDVQVVLTTTISTPEITITTHPASISVVSGSALNINLSVIATVTHGATLEYQWFTSDSNSNTNGIPIPGATSPEFILPENLTIGTYYFYVVVSALGAESVVSNIAVVTVTEEIINSPYNTPTPTPTPTPAPTPTQPPILTPSVLPQPSPEATLQPSESPMMPTSQTPIPFTASPNPNVTILESEYHRAYMFGDANGSFRPQGILTRAEAATMFARIMLLDFDYDIDYLPPGMTTFDAFADVTDGQWFYYYIAWVYDTGLIHGYMGNFRPNDPITREELVTLIMRTQSTNFSTNATPFTDANDIKDWAKIYVNAAYKKNLIIGDPNNNFRPRDCITRAESATVVNRLLGRINSNESMRDIIIENMEYVRKFPDVTTDAWYFASILAATNDHVLYRDYNDVIERKSFEYNHRILKS